MICGLFIVFLIFYRIYFKKICWIKHALILRVDKNSILFLVLFTFLNAMRSFSQIKACESGRSLFGSRAFGYWMRRQEEKTAFRSLFFLSLKISWMQSPDWNSSQKLDQTAWWEWNKTNCGKEFRSIWQALIFYRITLRSYLFSKWKRYYPMW